MDLATHLCSNATTGASALRSSTSSFVSQRIPSGALNGGVARPRAAPVRLLAGRCSLSNDEAEADDSHSQVGRRDVLRFGSGIALGSAVAAWSPQHWSVDTTAGSANAADLTQRIQRGEYLSKVKDTLREKVNSNRDLVPDFLRLALNDALTYDSASKTGGPNGSIRFELKRPENAGLDTAFKLVESTKQELDEKLSKWGSISYADLIIFFAQAAAKRTFIDSAISKCGGNEQKGYYLYQSIGSSGQWGQFEKNLGREDASGPDPEGRVPIWDKASLPEISKKFGEVGIKPRYVTVMSAFLGPSVKEVESKLVGNGDFAPYVKKYQDSRQTVSQTDYEVDLITTFGKVSVLGQKINFEAYTYKSPNVVFKL